MQKWNQDSHVFSLTHEATLIDELPQGVYVVAASKHGLFLERRADGLVLPPKIYGMEEAFIDRVARTFENTRANLGVMLNGIRGTGKTVTAELLALRLALPIILVTQDFPGLIDFMDSIPHPCTFLCDEFEKVFTHVEESQGLNIGGSNERGGGKLLPLMDGVMNSSNRKVFILTTNQLRVEPNLLQRPGRIRYLKTFGNLSRETIEMIVDDTLKHAQARKDVIEYIARLELITIDIVMAVIEEMNIHGGSPESLDGIFNVKKLEESYDVKRVADVDEREETLYFSAMVDPSPITADCVGHDLYVNRRDMGEIQKVDGEVVTVKRYNNTIEKYETHSYRISPRPTYNEHSFGSKRSTEAAL